MSGCGGRSQGSSGQASSSSATVAKGQWTVLFRSSDPSLWNTNHPKDKDGMAKALSAAPTGTRYLRLRRMDTKQAVIIKLRNFDLHHIMGVGQQFVWNGSSQDEQRHTKGQSYRNRLLGIADKKWFAHWGHGKSLVLRKYPKRSRSGFEGWGFSKRASRYSKQTYSWAGKTLKGPVTFEIAVTAGPLTAKEKTKVLNRSG